MGTQMLKYFLAYLGLFLGIALVVGIMVVFGGNSLKTFLDTQPLAVTGIVALLVLFVSSMFFTLQDIFIVFAPPAGTPPLAKQDLLSRLSAAFDRPVEGNKLFDVKITDSRAIVTWSSAITYFQGTSGGRTGRKRVVVLSLDEERKVAYFIMKDKDWNWNVSSNYAEFSLNYCTGLSAEFVSEVHPSIAYGPRGVTVDFRRLTYSSEELFGPIRSAVVSAGWTLRGGMIPSPWLRLALCGSLSLVVFLLLAPLMKGGRPADVPGKEVAPAVVPAKTAQGDRKEQTESYDKVLPLMTTEQVYLNGVSPFLAMPAQYFNDDYAAKFAAYARAYLKRADRTEEQVAAIRKFAAQRGIDLRE